VPLSTPDSTRTPRRRSRRDPKPRFKVDRRRQLDGIRGCPELLLDGAHPARDIQRFVAGLDLSALEAEYSSLGRHGHAPRGVLAVWLYASQIGLHHATKVARACATDVAMLFLSGGHAIAAGTLKRFRQQRRNFLQTLLTETVRQAHAAGLVLVEELATDSMRLRAHASPAEAGTVKRSRARLAELEAVDRISLSPAKQIIHDKKLAKHLGVLAQCNEQERTNVVRTNASASLMKFPSGAALPGHRITATASGVSERIIVSVLVDESTTDDGKLGAAVRDARQVLHDAGVPIEGMQVAADAGYFCETDLDFASQSRDWVDVLIAEGTSAAEPVTIGRTGFFNRDHFKILDDMTAICPADRPMSKPRLMGNGRYQWNGLGCTKCDLRPKCTSKAPGRPRSLTADMSLEKVRIEMRSRMARPDAKKRYGKRIATVEPVFSNIEDNMGFRRSSSRHPTTIVAEVLLKIVAHNLSRITAARRLACVHVALDVV
jgi:Transposase DDE domain